MSLPANGWNSFYDSLEVIDQKHEKAGLVVEEGEVLLEDKNV